MIFKNKPLIVLLLLNILYFSFDYDTVYNETKNNIKFILGEIGIKKYKTIKKYDSDNSDNLVIFFSGSKAIKLEVLDDMKSRNLLDENSDLIIPPNNYIWGGGSYNMSTEGYYYLADFNRGISRNFIVYNDDVKALLSALSWLHVHGNLDEKLSKIDMFKKMMTKKYL
ncbi:hypothetical protein [Campylobacter hyointestinalis]|nr:hypothetical protein [Campylobacter hyointestinalis]CUU85500.1 Uncharacterised protein [Campylobacter hyointestinalis subsp. hyointestinalis]